MIHCVCICKNCNKKSFITSKPEEIKFCTYCASNSISKGPYISSTLTASIIALLVAIGFLGLSVYDRIETHKEREMLFKG